MSRVYEFVFAPHRDRVNAEPCRMAGTVVPYSMRIIPWGRGYDTATCPYCGANSPVEDVAIEVQTAGGDA